MQTLIFKNLIKRRMRLKLDVILDQLLTHYNLGKFESLTMTEQSQQTYNKKRERLLKKAKILVGGLGMDKQDVLDRLTSKYGDSDDFRNFYKEVERWN